MWGQVLPKLRSVEVSHDMKCPNTGAMWSIPQSWAELLIRLGSQWVVCLGHLSECRPKSRRSWPPHVGHSFDPLAELCRFCLWVRDNQLWCIPISCNNCRFGCLKTCSGFADLSTVGKNFFLGCSVGRVFCKRVRPSYFGQDCARDFGVLHGSDRSITHGYDERFPWRGETTHQ